MRMVKKEFEKDGSGFLKLVPTEPEDMWHAYNLIAAGDTLTTTTTRKAREDIVQPTHSHFIFLF